MKFIYKWNHTTLLKMCDFNKNNQVSSVEELLKELERNTVSCKIVTFKFLGFSLATLNTIVSLIISIILMKSVTNYEKNQ